MAAAVNLRQLRDAGMAIGTMAALAWFVSPRRSSSVQLIETLNAAQAAHIRAFTAAISAPEPADLRSPAERYGDEAVAALSEWWDGF